MNSNMLDEEQLHQLSLKAYRDNQNAMDYMLQKGEKEGLKKGMKQGLQQGAFKKAIEIAKRLKEKGLSTAEIAETTGLSEDQVIQL